MYNMWHTVTLFLYRIHYEDKDVQALLVVFAGHGIQSKPQAAPMEQQHFIRVIETLIDMLQNPSLYSMKQVSSLMSKHSAPLGSNV